MSYNPESIEETPGKKHNEARVFFSIVGAVALSHACNDMIQATLPAIYPLLKSSYALSYTQIGMIALVYQITASLLQPRVGLFTDKRPIPLLLPAGMAVTLLGIGLMSIAGSYALLLLSSALIGVGSSTFHPEASRVARMASGGRFGTAQSCFQVGATRVLRSVRCWRRCSSCHMASYR